MDINKLLESMTPEVFQNLQYAVETGKWHNGTPLFQKQRSTSMYTMMSYQTMHNTLTQQSSVAECGDITSDPKASL